MRFIFFAAALALVFSGCGIYSNYKHQTIDTKGFYRAELGADTTATNAPKWEQLFTDPLLQQYIREGLQRNANLTIAQLQLEEAKATLRSAKLALLPSANATGRVSTSSYNGSDPQLAYNVGAEVSWTLDIFGRLNNARKAASAALEEREAYTQAARTQLVATIAEFYYTLEMLDAQMVVAENTLENWKQSVSTQEALFQAGLTQRSNINQAKASLLQAEIQCNELKVQIQKSENSFCSLLGRTATNVARGKWGEFVIPEHFSIGIPVEMLAARPDVRQAEATLKSAFYNTNAARSAFYPSLTLSGSLGWTNSAGTLISNPGALIWQAAGSLLQPLFNRGQLTANLKIAKARQEQARIRFRQTVLDAGNEVNNTLADMQNARTVLQLQKQQVARLEETLSDCVAQMRYGSGNYLQIIVARQSLLSAELSLLSTGYKELSSYIKLWVALGGVKESAQ